MMSPAAMGILGWVFTMEHFWLKVVEKEKKKKQEPDLLSPDGEMSQNIANIHRHVGTGTIFTSLLPLPAPQRGEQGL